MVAFWILATLMTLVALAIVLVPLLRGRTPSGPSADEAALAVLRGQRREIEDDIATGHLPADAREEAMAELIARTGEDVATDSTPPRAPATATKPWIAAAVAGVAIPALAFGIYAGIGKPSATDPATLRAAAPPGDERQIAAMVETLAAKVKERPDDVRGWTLLARSYAAMGRFQEATDAYEHLSRLGPPNAEVYADWADALGMAQGRKLAGRPFELVREALKLDPRHSKALALAGSAAMEAGDLGAAMGYWQRLAAELPADSPDAAEVRAIMADIRGRAGPVGRPLGPSATAPARMAAAPAEGAVSGSVSLAPALATQAPGDATLFIFARAEGGPRVPLAVMRTRASALPLAFKLDDSQAMAPGMNISSAASLRVEARISRSGNASPQSGDLVGMSASVKPGARDLKIVIDRVLP